MKKILLCITILLLVCNAFPQTVAPNLTVAGLLKVAYSFEDLEAYIIKRGFKHDWIESANMDRYIHKSYVYKPKTTKSYDYSSGYLYLKIYNNDGRSTLNYAQGKKADRKLIDEIRILGFKYESSYIGDFGESIFVYKRDHTKIQTKGPSTWRNHAPLYSVTIFSPAQPRVVSNEKAKPKRCSDEGSYDKGYSWAGNQKGLLADCDYLFDIAQASDSGPLSRYCFCQGVAAYRKQNR